VNSSTKGAMTTTARNDVIPPIDAEYVSGISKMISKINDAMTAIVAPHRKHRKIEIHC
jgi:hypothetical protein